LTNYAEAARSLFLLQEAERILLDATEPLSVSYANPWRSLAELYLREGRFMEALDALEHIEEFRQVRPPHMRMVDMNEDRRALSSFLLVIGKTDAALRLTERALLL